jgi:hypothetical protein
MGTEIMEEERRMEETEIKIKLQEILSNIQRKLKAPKNQFNSFGNYHYRNCEDIIEAIKPLLPDGAYVVIRDSIEMIGTRYYVKATAVLSYDGLAVYCHGYAREPEARKGMDESQITGATSSYARKYALNGLFLIDDTKDADSKDNSASQPMKPKYTICDAEVRKPAVAPAQSPVAGASEAAQPPVALDAPIIWNAGKPPHRGKNIREVDGSYLKWYEVNGPQDEYRIKASQELDRRDLEQDMNREMMP